MRWKSSLCLAVLGLGLILTAPGPVHAETHTIQQIGAWKAYGGTDNGGVQTCGLINTGKDRALSIRSWANSNDLAIQVFKNSWNIPKGAEVAIQLQFDSYTPWGAEKGTAMPPNGVEFSIPTKDTEAFIREFGLASRISVSFPNGNEPSWSGGLTGTAVLSGVFIDCIFKMRGGDDATQPYSSERTQPFSVAPSQPYRNGPSRAVTVPYSPGPSRF